MLRATCVCLLGLVTTALAEMEGFIVGGKFANIDHHAHSAFLNINCAEENGKKTGYICGSSIVNQKIMLTAAHCLHGCTYESHIRINLGNEHRNRGRTYSTYSFVIHEDYDPNTSSNDICLLRVNNPLLLNKKMTRVALMRNPPYNEKATVAGWGMVDEVRHKQSDWLKFVTQKVWNRNDCLRVFRYMPVGTICAANESPKDRAAQGDSGSALVVRGYIQVGLVSYKIPSISGHIVVYTDTGYFYSWIKAYARELACL